MAVRVFSVSSLGSRPYELTTIGNAALNLFGDGRDIPKARLIATILLREAKSQEPLF
jgi:hypothetical protein